MRRLFYKRRDEPGKLIGQLDVTGKPLVKVGGAKHLHFTLTGCKDGAWNLAVTLMPTWPTGWMWPPLRPHASIVIITTTTITLTRPDDYTSTRSSLIRRLAQLSPRHPIHIRPLLQAPAITHLVRLLFDCLLQAPFLLLRLLLLLLFPHNQSSPSSFLLYLLAPPSQSGRMHPTVYTQHKPTHRSVGFT